MRKTYKEKGYYSRSRNSYKFAVLPWNNQLTPKHISSKHFDFKSLHMISTHFLNASKQYRGWEVT